MEKSVDYSTSAVGSAIEKIKLQEQNKEAQLKAKREFEATKAALKRSIQDVISQAKKSQLEREELVKRTDELRSELTIQKIRRDALASQFKASSTKLEEFKTKVDQETTEMQELRSTYCKAVHDLSDECDVWALLMKPISTEPLPRAIKKSSDSNDRMMKNEIKLKRAIERREKAIAERALLKAEPDAGEEFVRIKNALRYSLEMITNLKNK